MNGRRSGFVWVLLALGLIIVVLARPDAHRPYDLDSTHDDGYRGLQLLLEANGSAVSRLDAADIDAAAAADVDVVYVPMADSVGDAMARDWEDFVGAGGRLVLGTPAASLGATAFDTGVDDEMGGGFLSTAGSFTEPDVCDVDGLDELAAIWTPFSSGLLEVDDQQSCFGNGDVAAVVRRTIGSGEVTTVAGPELFTNASMGAPDVGEESAAAGELADNAVLAQRLLSPDGAKRVGVVTSGISTAPLNGSKTLTDFLPSGVKLGLLQLVVAFFVYAMYRGRRHGRVVHDEVPVSIEGSAFVEAVGNLLERQGEHGRAAEVLRTGVSRDLARRLGLPTAVARPDLAAVIAQRTGRDPAAVADVLIHRAVASDDALVTLSHELESIRQEALHV